MPEIRLSCPKCTQRLAASTDALRTRMSCPRCGAEFLPMDVIPPQLTLPAMPVVTLTPENKLSDALASAASPAPAASTAPPSTSSASDSSSSTALTSLLEPPAGPADPAGAVGFFGGLPAAQASAPAASPALLGETPAAAAPEPLTGPPSHDPQPSPFLGLPRPAAKAAPDLAGAEIASFASNLQQTATRRAPWAIRYEHVAGIFAIAAGLALLALALFESTPLRVVLGVLATLFLAIALASAAFFAIARRASSPPTSPVAPASAQAPASASSTGAALSSLTGRARLVLSASAAAVIALSATATVLLALVTSAPEREPPRVAVQTNAAPILAPSKPELPPEQRADYKLKREGRSPVSGGVLSVPPSFRSDDGTFDLVVHFHGNTSLVEESVGAAKINALVYVINLGTGSGVYEDRYNLPAIFDDALTRVRDTAEKRGLQNAKMRRLALSSWSAGYGAIAKIIDVKKNPERIDALLLLDGLHVAYMDPKAKTDLDKARLAPFIRFAKEAADGKKLFSITHGDTETHGYASTGQAADALLREVGVERSPSADSTPRVTLAAAVGVVPKNAERWLEQTSEGRKGGMRVRGYVGKTPEHHMAHLIQMSVTVLADLADHWK